MNAGDTFRRGSGSHLWIVVSDPQQNANQVLLVNLTSNRAWQDQSCIISAGEHPFVTRETIVFYRNAMIASNHDLDSQLASGAIQLHDPVSSPLLQRIRVGAAASARIALGHQDLLRQQGLIS